MSWETQAWAAKQRPGNASAKLVLLGLASCSDARHCAHPSIKWLCEFSDLDRKTVIRALDKLSSGLLPLITDTGERRGRTGQVKVYMLSAEEGAAATAGDKDTESGTVPKTVQFPKRNSSAFPSKESQKRDTEHVLEPISPSEDKSSDVPLAGETLVEGEGEPAKPPKAEPKPRQRNTGERISADWTPPAIGDLPPAARRQAAQWPDGAYAAVAEAFHSHWLAESRSIGRKLDWARAWAKWVISEHSNVMRAARAGVKFVAPDRKPEAARAEPVAPSEAKGHECPRSAAIHARLRAELGERTHGDWVEPCAIVVGRREVVVVATTAARARWVEERFGSKIEEAARAVVAGGFQELRFSFDGARKAE